MMNLSGQSQRPAWSRSTIKTFSMSNTVLTGKYDVCQHEDLGGGLCVLKAKCSRAAADVLSASPTVSQERAHGDTMIEDFILEPLIDWTIKHESHMNVNILPVLLAGW